MNIKAGIILLSFVQVSCSSLGQNNEQSTNNNETMFKVEKSNQDWMEELSPEEYKILRQCGTEAPGTGKYYNFFEKGIYLCAGCGHELFNSNTKYSSGSGWPSFYDVIADSNVVLLEDSSHGMIRTEVRCANCGGHLGHVFTDGPEPTKLRYCINSIALKFENKEEEESDKE